MTGDVMKNVAELMNLKGRAALITGGAGHIGLAMADALAELGCDLVILDRPGEGLDQGIEKLKA